MSTVAVLPGLVRDHLWAIIAAAVGVAAALGMLVLWWRVVRRGSSEPTCARCGYAVRGLGGWQCPECGADLRDVGITPPTAREPGTLAFFVAWSLLTLMLAASVYALVSPLVPKSESLRLMFDLRPANVSGYHSVMVDTAARLRTHGRASASMTWRDSWQITMTLHKPGSAESTIEIDATTLKYAVKSPRPVPRPAEIFGLDVVLAWMAAAGIDTQDGNVQNQARELKDFVLAAHYYNATWFKFINYYIAGSVQRATSWPIWWALWPGVTLAVGLWLTGLLTRARIMRRRRRRDKT